MRVALTGASGFVGKHLQKSFSDHIIIERHDSVETILEKLEGVDAVFNLAGAPIIKRWSSHYKDVLLSSRIQTTQRVVQAINQSKVKHFISTSAIGAYPDDVACDESITNYNNDFLGSLTKAWEAEALLCQKPTSIIRFGVILGKDAGALSKMLLPFKLGLGGIIADGKMMTSWIDIHDLMRIYAYVLEKKLTGIINATAPHPVTNYTFTKALGQALHRPTIIPLPGFVLKLLFGEGATAITSSKEVYPKVLSESGFKFDYEDIKSSLNHILSEERR